MITVNGPVRYGPYRKRYRVFDLRYHRTAMIGGQNPLRSPSRSRSGYIAVTATKPVVATVHYGTDHWFGT